MTDFHLMLLADIAMLLMLAVYGLVVLIVIQTVNLRTLF
jgi:hypothetical protein